MGAAVFISANITAKFDFFPKNTSHIFIGTGQIKSNTVRENFNQAVRYRGLYAVQLRRKARMAHGIKRR